MQLSEINKVIGNRVYRLGAYEAKKLERGGVGSNAPDRKV